MKKQVLNIITGILILILVIYWGMQGRSGTTSHEEVEKESEWGNLFATEIVDMSEKAFFPGVLSFTEEKEEINVLENVMQKLFPLFYYVEESAPVLAEVEDSLTYEMILEAQANDEYTMSEDLEEMPQETIDAQVSSIDMSMEKLKDFNYLLSTFYTVDSTTMIGEDQLNVEDLLKYDMKINTETEGPKVLIFHTHSQEAFVDSVAGDASTTIVGMGAYLTQKLEEKGIKTLHHDGVYDLINGKLDRSKAYQMAETGVKEILNQYPSIEVVIDLHRDGVGENTHLVTSVDGKQTAKIMFFNGLSRTKTNGDIDYLYNPYIDENLSFSFQMQLAAEQMYPGFARRIYLKGYRYSLHMMPKSLLIEAGAQTNTVEEMKNAMDLLANILSEVLL